MKFRSTLHFTKFYFYAHRHGELAGQADRTGESGAVVREEMEELHVLIKIRLASIIGIWAINIKTRILACPRCVLFVDTIGHTLLSYRHDASWNQSGRSANDWRVFEEIGRPKNVHVRASTK